METSVNAKPDPEPSATPELQGLKLSRTASLRLQGEPGMPCGKTPNMASIPPHSWPTIVSPRSRWFLGPILMEHLHSWFP